MTYEGAVGYLFSILGAIRPEHFGLERMEDLCRRLGNPERSFRVIHVAGTNGKGSTAAMIEAGLRAAGHRTGLYTSPHLSRFNERYRIDGEPIDDAGFARAIDRVRTENERLLAESSPRFHPTMFETVTAAAFCAFEESDVDFGIIEVGLGGRLDASNVVRPHLCVVTPIALDHERWLGRDLRSIAAEKAGTFKQGALAVVSATQAPPALEVLRTTAEGLEIPFREVSGIRQAADPTPDLRGFFSFEARSADGLAHRIKLSLAGEHQVGNALTAIAALAELGVGSEGVAALSEVQWPGRLEWLSDDLLLDAAHNPSGAATLQRYLQRFCTDRPIHLIYGSSRDKAVEEVAGQLFPAANRVTLTRAKVPRSVTPNHLAEMLDHLHADLACAAGVPEALALIRPDELTVIAGSIFLIGEAREQLTAP